MEFRYEDQFLLFDAPRRKYIREHCAKCVHWGQRKLILSEIQFFTIFWGVDKPGTVVYAGAAPGNHTPFLADMFPELRFELYDPSPFAIEETDRIKLHNEFFTDDVARQWQGRDDVLFISDVRGVDPMENTRLVREANVNKVGAEEATKIAQRDTEEKVWAEMLWQQTWTEIIKPAQAMLKFRLPYVVEPDKGDVIAPYLDGHVLLQCFPPINTTETRLVPVQPLRKVGWSCLQYEEQLHYHNFVVRDQQYLNPATKDTTPIDPPELLNDFESTLEWFILSEYVRIGRKGDIIQLSHDITMQINAKKKKRKDWWTLDRIRHTEGRSASRRVALFLKRQKKEEDSSSRLPRDLALVNFISL